MACPNSTNTIPYGFMWITISEFQLRWIIKGTICTYSTHCNDYCNRIHRYLCLTIYSINILAYVFFMTKFDICSICYLCSYMQILSLCLLSYCSGHYSRYIFTDAITDKVLFHRDNCEYYWNFMAIISILKDTFRLSEILGVYHTRGFNVFVSTVLLSQAWLSTYAGIYI